MNELLDEVFKAKYAAEYAKKYGFEPDPWQADLLNATDRNIILNCSRQVGKSTTVSIKAAHTGEVTSEGLVVITSPSERQSLELMLKAKHFINQSGIAVENETKHSIEFVTGTRLFALPGSEKTIRGFSAVDLLIIDEASRLPQETYYAVEPMMAVSQGQTILLSTPCGKRGFFYEIWQHGEGWKRIMIPATECPRIPAEWLEKKRRELPYYWFMQEYMCEFLDAESQLISSDDIEVAFSGGVSRLFDTQENDDTVEPLRL
jgi:hypothetical protein